MNEPLSIVIAGEVDHGKSSIVGRILEDTGAIPPSRIEAVKKICEASGKIFEPAFLLDAFDEEQKQGVTIDITRIYFDTPRRRYLLIDAPGHKEFLKNMVSGSSAADAAVLVVDAQEGVQEQTRRHGYLLGMLGIRSIVVVLNKMDLVHYDQARYQAVVTELKIFLTKLNIKANAFVPISARDGENISRSQKRAFWYEGPTLLEALDQIQDPKSLTDQPFRMAVQDVYKFDERRILAGRIESGRIEVGQSIKFSPSGRVARVASIERWNAPVSKTAEAGDSIGITLDEQAFVERGQIATMVDGAVLVSDIFDASIFWMGKQPATPGMPLTIQFLTQEADCVITSINSITDATNLSQSTTGVSQIYPSSVADVSLKIARPIAFDSFEKIRPTGRFVLLVQGKIAGGGIVKYPPMIRASDRKEVSPAVVTRLTRRGRYRESPWRSFLKASSWRVSGFITTFFLVSFFTRNFKAAAEIGLVEAAVKVFLFFLHERLWDRVQVGREEFSPVVLWFTGLPSAGKSTLSEAVGKELVARGLRVEHLDGDSVRAIFPETGFSPQERDQHIRRVGYLASRLESNGVLVIASFVSPHRESRQFVRNLCQNFVEVYVSTPLAVAEKRDVKGLYAKARRSEILNFTGVQDQYEAPENAELVINTEGRSPEDCVQEILSYLDKRLEAKLK